MYITNNPYDIMATIPNSASFISLLISLMNRGIANGIKINKAKYWTENLMFLKCSTNQRRVI